MILRDSKTKNLENYNPAFWSALGKLVSESKVIINHPKDRYHP